MMLLSIPPKSVSAHLRSCYKRSLDCLLVIWPFQTRCSFQIIRPTTHTLDSVRTNLCPRWPPWMKLNGAWFNTTSQLFLLDRKRAIYKKRGKKKGCVILPTWIFRANFRRKVLWKTARSFISNSHALFNKTFCMLMWKNMSEPNLQFAMQWQKN